MFVDECSTNIATVARYARAPKGQRAYGKAPRNWGGNVTLVSSITLEEMGPSMSIEGSADGESFGFYLNNVLCPSLFSSLSRPNISGLLRRIVAEPELPRSSPTPPSGADETDDPERGLTLSDRPRDRGAHLPEHAPYVDRTPTCSPAVR